MYYFCNSNDRNFYKKNQERKFKANQSTLNITGKARCGWPPGMES